MNTQKTSITKLPTLSAEATLKLHKTAGGFNPENYYLNLQRRVESFEEDDYRNWENPRYEDWEARKCESDLYS